MKCDQFLAICVVATESASQLLRDCCCTGFCAHKREVIINRLFFYLFGLFLRFPPFGGLTLFVPPWLPTVFDPVALFATISAFPFHGTESFGIFVPFSP